MKRENKKTITAIMIIILIVVLGFVAYKTFNSGRNSGEEKIVTDLKNSPRKVPEGFPLDLPVQEMNVKESYKIINNTERTEEYVVGFETDASREEIWSLYSSYLVSHDYIHDQDKTNQEIGYILAYKDNNTLEISLGNKRGKDYITIKYLKENI